MIDTVIYDFDGTVMDTNEVVIRSWQYTYRKLTGRDGSLDYILSTFGEPLEQSMQRTFPDIPVKQSVETYRSWHRENFGAMIRLFPGIREMLEEVKRRGYKTGIATSRVAQTLYQGLDKFGIRKYFDEIVTVEEVTKHKPDPESLLTILQKLGSVPEQTVMLGDSGFDIRCANNAGAVSILVGWSATFAGKAISDFPDGEAPDYIIQSPGDLFQIL